MPGTRDKAQLVCDEGEDYVGMRGVRISVLLVGLALLHQRAGAQLARDANNPFPSGIPELQKIYKDHAWNKAVKEIWPEDLEGADNAVFRSVSKDADQQNIYAENMEVDLSQWRHRAPFKTTDLLDASMAMKQRASTRLLAIHKGKLYLVWPRKDGETCARPCDPLLEDLVETLAAWVAEGDFPDAVFHINVGDVNTCKPGVCKVPMFAFYKMWDSERDEDLLVPLTQDTDHPLYNFPWSEKIERAFWRGTGYCSSRSYAYVKDTCSRLYLTRLSEGIAGEDALAPTDLLEVGLMEDYAPGGWVPRGNRSLASAGASGAQKTQGGAAGGRRTTQAAMREGTGGGRGEMGGRSGGAARAGGGAAAAAATKTIKGRGFMPLPEHARFKYLLHLDGITASGRLSKLLHTNSPVFKQRSPWIEWYHRSLVEGAHYISFWETHRKDLIPILRFLQSKPRYLQDVARRGQAFSYAYTSSAARRLYWRRLLHEYVKLFPDMTAAAAKIAREVPAFVPGSIDPRIVKREAASRAARTPGAAEAGGAAAAGRHNAGDTGEQE